MYKQIPVEKMQGVIVFDKKSFADGRGFFMEVYNKEVFEEAGFFEQFIQDNLSFSKKGVLRGLHLQKEPYTQGKLITIIDGHVLDVAVDLREGSPTFGDYIMIELSSQNNKQLYVPPGFAHGFFALQSTHFFYKCTAPYRKDFEVGIMWDDEELQIPWGEGDKIISDKDNQQMTFKDFRKMFIV